LDVNGIQKDSRSFGIVTSVMARPFGKALDIGLLSGLWRPCDRLFLVPFNRLKSLRAGLLSLNMLNG
jgi:hypothetical protein